MPETWTHWSGSTTPTIETVYGQYRQGASTWDNSDFTDYPFFKIPNVVNLRNLLINDDIQINTPLDNTLAYTAMANIDLPQCNRYVFNSIHHSTTDYIAKSDITPIPFSFGYYYRNENGVDTPCRLGNIYGFDGFPNNASVLDIGKMHRFSPFAGYDTVYNNVNGDYNPILRISPVTSFGVKSVILEINVGYIDYGTTMLTGNLQSYLNHDDTWLQNHPIVMAYCIPYFRTNVNGTYTTSISGQSIRFTGICPVFYPPFRDRTDTYDIYNYLTVYNYGSGSGCLPIFGGVYRDSFSTSVGIGVSRIPDDQLSKTNLSRYAVFYGPDRGTMHYSGTDASGLLYCTLDLSVRENVEYILRGAAAYGLFFCTSIGTLGNNGRDSGPSERWLDNDMYCGVIADDGMTYGDYTRGSDNADNSVYGWTDSTQTPFDPSNIPDTDNTKYDYETKYRQLGYFPTACNAYVCGGGTIQKLSDVIATSIRTRPDPDVPISEYALDNGLTNNPIDTIVSIKMYPSTQVPAFGSDIEIMFGAWSNPAVVGKELAKNYGSADFTFTRNRQNGFVAKYGNSFLDYAPYTRAELIIPYCGTVQLSAADFLNHDINVHLVIDYLTGACTAFIQRDGIAVLTCSGSIGVDIPITGIQTATFDSQRLNAVLARENALNNSNTAGVGALVSALGAVGSIATGNVVGAIASVGGLMSSINSFNQTANTYQKADYDLKHLQVPVKAVQSASPLISYVLENVCRLIIYRPILSEDYNKDVYADTVGFACLMNGQVKDFSGLTIGNINTDGIAAPEPVKAMIQKLFANGVYL